MSFKIYPPYRGAKVISYNIYCGEKEVPPKNKVRGRPNQCFKLGKRVGYYLGKIQTKPATKPSVPIPQAIPQAIPQVDTRRSIKELYKNVPKTTRIRDYMSTLPIRNPEYNFGGSKYKSVKQKKALGTEGLRQWLINEVKEYKE
jgi:hypothetical protein